MATVYRATDLHLERSIAVKVLTPSLAPLLGEDRFQREIHVAARLQHPGIVPLYEAGGSGPLRFYTMPFIEGETLRARLDRERQLPVDEALHIALEVADALRYAHSHGVVHRDIKPENILLNGERVQVADFGIARAISLAGEDRLTSAGLAIGTPWYMSPEQAAHDDALDGRADIYSLGCLCYEMLAGQPPFTGVTPQVIVARHLSEPVPSLKTVRATVPEAFLAAINAMLAKAPADRPDANALLQLLHRAATHPTVSPGVGTRKRRALVGGSAVFLLATAGFLLGRPEPQLDPRSVVVFPFSESTPALANAGQAVAHLVGSALEHTEPLRWIDGAREVELSSAAPYRGLSNREARRITRRLGARYYLEGALVRHGDSISVTARLHDIGLDSIHRQTATGTAAPEPVEAAATLARRAVVPLLEVLVGPSRHVALEYLENRHPGAIALWLQGEQQMRSADFGAALDSYRRALSLDSTLAVAALTGAGVALWTHASGTADSLAHLALRHSEGLPPRNLAYINGMVSYLDGRADSALNHFSTALEIDSLWPHGWMMVGDTYHHLVTRHVDQDIKAEAAFRRSVELDPGFGPAVFHLAESVLRRGDVATGSELLTRFRGVTRESALVTQLEMMLTCLRSGPDAVDWAAMASREPLRVLGVTATLGVSAKRLDCAEAAARSLYPGTSTDTPLAVRWAAFKWLHNLAVARGDLDQASALTDSAVNDLTLEAIGLHILDAVELGTDSLDALRALEVIGRPLGDLDVNQLWHHAIWSWSRHNTPRLDSIIAELESRPADRSAAVLRGMLSARALLLSGDTAATIDALGRLEPGHDGVQWDLWQSLASEQLLHARLLLAVGRPEEALASASRFDNSQSAMYLYYLPASLVIRHQAARQLGRSATAELMEARLRNLGRSDLIQAAAAR